MFSHKDVSGLQKVFICFSEVWEDGTLGSQLPPKPTPESKTSYSGRPEASQATYSIVLCDKSSSRLVWVERDFNINLFQLTGMGQDTFFQTRLLKAMFLLRQDSGYCFIWVFCHTSTQVFCLFFVPGMGRQPHGLEIKQYSSCSPRGIDVSAYTRRAHQVALNKKPGRYMPKSRTYKSWNKDKPAWPSGYVCHTIAHAIWVLFLNPPVPPKKKMKLTLNMFLFLLKTSKLESPWASCSFSIPNLKANETINAPQKLTIESCHGNARRQVTLQY